MPLAFVGAGLLEMKTSLLMDRKMTFFHRCEHFEMPPLEVADAIVGLAGPIKEAGGKITEEALELGLRGCWQFSVQAASHRGCCVEDRRCARRGHRLQCRRYGDQGRQRRSEDEGRASRMA